MLDVAYKSFCERAVVIPANLRRKFAIESGMTVKIIEVNGSIQIVPLPKDSIAVARGFLKHRKGQSLTEILLKERQRDLRNLIPDTFERG